MEKASGGGGGESGGGCKKQIVPEWPRQTDGQALTCLPITVFPCHCVWGREGRGSGGGVDRGRGQSCDLHAAAELTFVLRELLEEPWNTVCVCVSVCRVGRQCRWYRAFTDILVFFFLTDRMNKKKYCD